ncbi:MAG: DNRLRE domain-containing protein, partial [Candidatus Methylomirabilales bacterium]
MTTARPYIRRSLCLTILGLLFCSLPPLTPQAQALTASHDTFVRRFLPNKNRGDRETLRLRALPKNRTLVQFDQAAIDTAVAGNTLVSAKLRLHVTSSFILNQSGKEVAVHRMTQAWTEGGATWNCPDDTNTSNRRPDCTRWNMKDRSQWPFEVTPTAVVLHEKGQSGVVEWDVTSDVAQFLAGTSNNFGWIVKQVKERTLGQVKYSSREGVFPPELVLEVSAPTIPAGFGTVLGRVVDATTGQPLAGTTVKALGTTSEVLTDNQGRFELPAPAGNRAPIYFNKGGYVDAKAFAVVEAGRESTVGTVRLQPFDQVATRIDANGGSHTDSTGTVQVIFPAGAVGTAIDVTATVFPTAEEFPVKFPEGQAYLGGVQFTPENLTFAQPVTVRIANNLNLPPGTDVPFAFANHSDQNPNAVFFDPGMFRVSPDGQFLEAQLPHFSCIALLLPIKENRAPVLQELGNVSVENSPQKCCPTLGSRVGAQDGTLFLDQVLPSTRTLGRANSLTLTYSSATADPHPLIRTEALLDPAATILPEQVRWQFKAGPLEEERIFQSQPGTFRYAFSWEPRDSRGNLLPTGSHRVDVTISNDYQSTLATTNAFGGPPLQDLGIPVPGLTPETVRPNARVVIHNRQQSPFGAGWGLQGLQRLHPEPDGSVVITEGDGTALTFRTTPLLYASMSPGTTTFGAASALDPDTGDIQFVFPTILA